MSGPNNRHDPLSPGHEQEKGILLRKSMRVSHYSYQILDPEPSHRQIRLLKLLPSTDFWSPVQCEMNHVSLQKDPTPTYQAISYCWGDPKVTAPVYISDSEIRVTINLVTALLYFRGRNEARVLWVDAICIDQTNIRERNEQVLMMRDIYQKAESTLIWLGQGDIPGVDWKDLSSKLLQWHLKLIKEDPWRLNDPHAEAKGRWFDESVPNADNQRICAYLALFSREWFQRIWIVQEFAVSAELFVCVDHSLIPWTQFWVAGKAAVVGWKPPADLLRGVEKARSILAMRESYRDKATITLVSLLPLFRHKKASDPRDMIFALLGLMKNVDIDIELDYNRSVDDVYFDAAVSILRSAKDLELLAMAGTHLLQEIPATKLPSWVPDWRLGEVPMQIRYRDIPITFKPESDDYILEGNAWFQAAGSSQYDLVVNMDQKMLGVDGFELAVVQSISGPWQAFLGQPLKDSELVQRILKRLDSYEEWQKVAEVASRPFYYKHGVQHISMATAFWSTVLGGVIVKEEYPVVGAVFWHGEELQADTNRILVFRKLVRRLQRLLLPIRHEASVSDGGYVGARMSRVIQWISKVSGISVRRLRELENTYYKSIDAITARRRIARLTDGYIGLVPDTTQVGDRITLLAGSNVPLILRPKGDNWELVGEAYVDRIMYGEAWDASKCERLWLA